MNFAPYIKIIPKFLIAVEWFGVEYQTTQIFSFHLYFLIFCRKWKLTE